MAIPGWGWCFLMDGAACVSLTCALRCLACVSCPPHRPSRLIRQAAPSSPANKGVNELFRTEVLTPFQEDLLEKSKEIYNGANILITGATGSFGKVHNRSLECHLAKLYPSGPQRPGERRASQLTP